MPGHSGPGHSSGWASCGEGPGPGPGAEAGGQSGQEPAQPSGSAWPPPPAMQMPRVRVLLVWFRVSGAFHPGPHLLCGSALACFWKHLQVCLCCVGRVGVQPVPAGPCSSVWTGGGEPVSGFPREGRGQDPWRGSWGERRVCGPCPRQHVESRPGFSYWWGGLDVAHGPARGNLPEPQSLWSEAESEAQKQQARPCSHTPCVCTYIAHTSTHMCPHLLWPHAAAQGSPDAGD